MLTPQFTKWHRQTKELGNWPILREWKEFSFGSSDVCHKWPTIKQPTQRPSSISAVLLVNLSQPTLKPLDIKTRQRRNWSMKTKLERNSIEPKNINLLIETGSKADYVNCEGSRAPQALSQSNIGSVQFQLCPPVYLCTVYQCTVCTIQLKYEKSNISKLKLKETALNKTIQQCKWPPHIIQQLWKHPTQWQIYQNWKKQHWIKNIPVKHWKCTVSTIQLCPPHTIQQWNCESFTQTIISLS